MPWWLKILAKIVLARLPLPSVFWRKVGLFKPGGMADFDYAFDVFESHFKASELPVDRPFTCLELGPGDSLFSALIARAFGAEKIWLINSTDQAIDNSSAYEQVSRLLRERGYHVPVIDKTGHSLMSWANMEHVI